MDADVVIIGSGMGGSAVAWALADSGADVLVLERGGPIAREPQNRSAEAVFVEQRYRTAEQWLDDAGNPFRPGQYYNVGGCTKFYGSALFRLRERDFEAVEHEEGISPAWPISYQDLAPYYDLAEQLFGVHGQAGSDPTDPAGRPSYPYPPLPQESTMAELAQRFRSMGLQPFPLPSSVQLHPGGNCERCGSCDAFPCMVDAKADAETALLRPAMRRGKVRLLTGTRVHRLLTDDRGQRIVAAEVEQGGETKRIRAGLFVLAAGAINSAALLLASANEHHRQGLANASGAVGRYFMNHNCTALMALSTRENDSRNPKTLALNDFYFGGSESRWPLGNLQTLGKVQEPMLRNAMRWLPKSWREQLCAHSVDWYAMSEDLPHPDSRVTLEANGQIRLNWVRTNLKPHARLVQTAKHLLREAGYPLVLARRFEADTPSHQCGTVRFGNDPAQAPLDPFCRTWQHDNLYVVDGGFFPSSAAVNPALTIAAQGLRVGTHLATRLQGVNHDDRQTH
jgi:choline dehydrogenase-like flavoprotein